LTDRVLVDTGPFVSTFNETDYEHRRCADQFAALNQPVLTCWPVLIEAAWILRARPDRITRMLSAFEDGAFALLPLDETDLPPISAILTKFRDLRVQLADAALLHLANRESIHTIFTLDRRDFEVFRLKNGKRPRLIP
jgi:predicted nucleic acid-binding protein